MGGWLIRALVAVGLVGMAPLGVGPEVVGMGASRAGAAATTTVAFWSMDEAPGSTVLVDSSGNGRHGTIGDEVITGATYQGATVHRFPDGPPSSGPVRPEHLDRVPDSTLLDPGTSDYAVTIRMRQTRPYGNVVQKGQNATPGGYWKFESPNGNITCLFKGSSGAQRAIVSPISIQDGVWHVVRCERTTSGLRMTIDGVSVGFLSGNVGSISNSREITIGGKGVCDQIEVTCDYFAGDIDYIRIEKGSGGPANQRPVADIEPECAGLICSLVGSGSTDADGAIQSWSWAFGDGTTATGANVTHTYGAAGTYPVTLTVTDDRGSTDTETTMVTVAPDAGSISYIGGASASANATFHTVTIPSNVQPGDGLLLFHTQNTTATISGPTQVTGWTTLDTVDGGYGRTRVWKKVAAPGDAGASVRVNLSSQSKANLMVVAYRGTATDPVAAFARVADTSSSTAHPTPFVTPPAPGSWVVSYWMHGDSSTSALSAPAGVTARATGTQTGSGRVTTLLADSSSVVPAAPYGGLVATGSTASTTSSAWSIALAPGVATNLAPTASIGAVCDNLECSFGATANDADGQIVSYEWDFGDGATATGPDADHTFTSDGSYTVSLTVTDDDDASTTVLHPVAVAANVAPVAAFSPTCLGSTCTFDRSASSDADGSVVAQSWDFGDGAQSDAVQPTYAFPVDGTYTVTLTVTDDDGDIGTASIMVTVPAPNLAPTAAFDSDCTELSCTFDASGSIDLDGSIDSYTWDFGDGNQSTEANPAHAYGEAGVYTVTLTVTDDDQESASIAHDVTLSLAPVDVITFVGATISNANATVHTVTVPAAVQPGDGMLLILAQNTTATMSTPLGWTVVGTVVDDGVTTRVWRKVAGPTDAGSSVSVSLGAISKAGFTVAAYRGTALDNPVAAFAGVGIGGDTTVRTTPTVAVTNPQSWVVSFWSHRDSATNALTPPPGVAVRAAGTQTSGGRVTTLLADSAGLVPVGTAGGLVATAPSASSAATAWTFVLAPAL